MFAFRGVPKGQKIYNVGMDFVPVDSCFGGLSFYKKSFIKECRYDSKSEDCEHVSFHACVKQKHNGRIFMNPSQIAIYSHIYKASRILKELLSQKATRHLAPE